MTLREFLANLGQNLEVQLPEGPRLATSRLVVPLAPTLVDAMRRVLADDANVRYGWPLDEIQGPKRSGQHKWLLIMDEHLVTVVATLKSREGGTDPFCDVSIRRLPLSDATLEVVWSYYVGGRPRIDDGMVKITIQDETFEAPLREGEAEHLTDLVRHLRDAIAQARSTTAR